MHLPAGKGPPMSEVLSGALSWTLTLSQHEDSCSEDHWSDDHRSEDHCYENHCCEDHRSEDPVHSTSLFN